MRCLHLAALLLLFGVSAHAQDQTQDAHESTNQLESYQYKNLGVFLRDASNMVKSHLEDWSNDVKVRLHLRKPVPKTSFQWIYDPDCSKPCTQPHCSTLCVEGYNVVPMHNITEEVKVVMQGPERKDRFGTIDLFIKTQPNCVVSACHMTKRFFLFDTEECFAMQVQDKPNQPDGSVLLELYGMFFDSPEGELYAWFEKKNYASYAQTCTFDVVSGVKWWG